MKSALFGPVNPWYISVFTRGGQPFFSGRTACEMLVNILTYNRFALNYRVLGFVIMPDHLHIILLPQKVPVTQVIMKNTANFTRYYHQLTQKRITIWEKDYYRLQVINEEMLQAIQNHIHTNPCRNKLVEDNRSYYYSSYRFYQEKDQDFSLLLDYIEDDY